jgi:hypothetical protein
MELLAQVASLKKNTDELGYNAMKGTECFVSIQTSGVLIKDFDVIVKSERLLGTAQYLTL